MHIRLTGLLLVVAGLVAGCNGQATLVSGSGTTAVAPTQGASEKPRGARSDVAAADAPVSDDINLPPEEVPAVGTKLELSDDEWRERLTRAQYRVLRTAGTEFPGTGAYNKLDEKGTYHCSACNNPLFASETKFDSKTGWPSFYQPLEDGRLTEVEDSSHGMTRTEVVCAVCDGHLGHVFNDGPQPTGLRYCINSVSLYFRPAAEEAAP